MKMTKMAGVTQAKAWFRKSPVCSSLTKISSRIRGGPVAGNESPDSGSKEQMREKAEANCGHQEGKRGKEGSAGNQRSTKLVADEHWTGPTSLSHRHLQP